MSAPAAVWQVSDFMKLPLQRGWLPRTPSYPGHLSFLAIDLRVDFDPRLCHLLLLVLLADRNFDHLILHLLSGIVGLVNWC